MGSLLASVPDHLGVDRGVTGVPAVAGKQPCTRVALAVAPVLTQVLEQFGTELSIEGVPFCRD